MGPTCLDYSRTGSNSVVRHGLVTACKDNVGLASEALGNGNREAAINGGGRDKGGTGYRDEGGVDLRNTLGGFESVALRNQVSTVASVTQ